MTVLFYIILLALLATGLAWLFISVPAARLATLVTTALPMTMIGLGALLMLVGRGGLGIPLIVIGLGLWRRMRGTGRINSPGGGRRSTVRSAAFDMELDHETGEMDGTVLIGQMEGKRLADLTEPELMTLFEDIGTDAESVALLEAYLDRRMPRWREDAQAHTGGGQGAPPVSGSMTKEEAYQVLGLEPGATPREIKAAWRKLVKSVHPDSGGSEFLAAKINAAKDVLLD